MAEEMRRTFLQIWVRGNQGLEEKVEEEAKSCLVWRFRHMNFKLSGIYNARINECKTMY